MSQRKEIRELDFCQHGGIDREGIEKGIKDFSANLNPYGPPGFIYEVIKEAIDEIGLYPDTFSAELRSRIADRFHLPEDRILVGAGVSELINIVAITFLSSSRRAVIPMYTYGEYEKASRMMGATIERVSMSKPDLKIDANSFAETIRRNDVVFLCNPNNPTGQYLGEKDVKRIVDEAHEKDALVIIDEAYVDFVDDAFDAFKLLDRENVIIMRSFTKAYGIPGVRIGYAVGSEENIEAMSKVKAPWSTDVFAQKIGSSLMSDEALEFLRNSKRKIEESKRKMETALHEIGLKVRSDANFFLADLDLTERHEDRASRVKDMLLRQHRILVRDCSSFRLPSHIRFSVRKDDENDALISALHSTLKKLKVIN